MVRVEFEPGPDLLPSGAISGELYADFIGGYCPYDPHVCDSEYSREVALPSDDVFVSMVARTGPVRPPVGRVACRKRKVPP